MVSPDAARTVVGIIGNIIALFFFLSPVPTYVEMWKKRSVDQYSPVPYLAGLMNCMVWTLYGLPTVQPNGLLILTINVAGVFIESVYLSLFFSLSPKKMRLKVLLVVLVELIFTALLGSLVLNLVDTPSKRSTIIGIVCIFFTALMYSSPLSVMKLVITTKSVEFMPFYLSLATLMNGLIWSAYALIRFDPIILVPSGLGAVFGLTQLILYAVYYKSTQQIIESRKEKEANLSLVVLQLEDPKFTEINTLQNASHNAI